MSFVCLTCIILLCLQDFLVLFMWQPVCQFKNRCLRLLICVELWPMYVLHALSDICLSTMSSSCLGGNQLFSYRIDVSSGVLRILQLPYIRGHIDLGHDSHTGGMVGEKQLPSPCWTLVLQSSLPFKHFVNGRSKFFNNWIVREVVTSAISWNRYHAPL